MSLAVTADRAREAAGKVAAVLNSLPDDVDAVLACAQKMLVRAFSAAELESLFDAQLRTLAARGCDDAIVEQLRALRSTVIGEASQITFKRGHVPFLPVIPEEVIALEEQTSMIDWDGRRGHADGWSFEISRDVDSERMGNLPRNPYYIADVGIRKVQKEDNLSPLQAARTILNEGGFPLDVAEGISLAIQGANLDRSYHIRTYFLHEQFRLKNSDGYPRAYTIHGESQICPSGTIPMVSISYAHSGHWFSAPHCSKRISVR
jgi:hypothetical protein